MRFTPLRCFALTACICFVVASPSHGGQEVRWRSDYAAARAEAQDSGRPLVLVFMSANSAQCTKLETTTLRQDSIAQILNEHFIAVRLDGVRDVRVTEVLGVRSYPTLVIAGCDGRIYRVLPGYVDAAGLSAQLREAAYAVVNPEWMTRALEEATRAAAATNYVQAVALLRTLVEDNQQRPVQKQARRLLGEIEAQARLCRAQALQLEAAGKYLEAADALTTFVRTYAGTEAAADAAPALAALNARPELRNLQRRRQAAELLSQAKNDLGTQQYRSCMDRCELLTRAYGDLQEGAEALKMLDEITDHPDWLSAACKSLSDELGDLYLALAESWLRKGQPQLACEWLNRVLTTLPGSRHAELAKARLDQIRGEPTALRPADKGRQ